MKKLLIIGMTLLVLGVLLFILLTKDEKANSVSEDHSNKVGDEMKKKEDAKNKFNPNEPKDEKPKKLTFSLHEEKADNGEKNFVYVVKNESDMPENLEFGTSQKYEFEITNQDNELVHRFSEGKLFMQVIQKITLKPGETLDFDIVLPEIGTGEYTLTIYLAAKGWNNEKQSIRFSVDE